MLILYSTGNTLGADIFAYSPLLPQTRTISTHKKFVRLINKLINEQKSAC